MEMYSFKLEHFILMSTSCTDVKGMSSNFLVISSFYLFKYSLLFSSSDNEKTYFKGNIYSFSEDLKTFSFMLL